MRINYTCIFQDDLQRCSNLKELNKLTLRTITEKISSFVCKPRNSLPYLDRITESYLLSTCCILEYKLALFFMQTKTFFIVY